MKLSALLTTEDESAAKRVILKVGSERRITWQKGSNDVILFRDSFKMLKVCGIRNKDTNI